MLRTVFASCLLGCAIVAADEADDMEIRVITELAEAIDGDYINGGQLKEVKAKG